MIRQVLCLRISNNAVFFSVPFRVPKRAIVGPDYATMESMLHLVSASMAEYLLKYLVGLVVQSVSCRLALSIFGQPTSPYKAKNR